MNKGDILILIKSTPLTIEQCFDLEEKGFVRIEGGFHFNYEWSDYMLEQLSVPGLKALLQYVRNEDLN